MFPKTTSRYLISSLTWKISFCAFLVSVGINFTRVPIIYVFRLMICDEFYRHREPYKGTGDRCSVSEIDASTAAAVSVLGATITINGVFNLIFANWSMKKFRLKNVLIQQLVGPTVRLGIQLVGVNIGGGKGVLIVQISQLLGVVGGSTGYVLILTAMVSHVVSESQQTTAFGRLHGAVMLGTAVAHLSSGIVSETFGVEAAFWGSIFCMIASILYAIVALPNLSIPSSFNSQETESTFAKLAQPFRVLLFRRAGETGLNSRLLLALGVFCGVLATGFIPILLQMYSTNTFGFTSKQNGYLMALTFGIRSIFLTFGFPVVVSVGRRWSSAKQAKLLNVGSSGANNRAGEIQDETRPLLMNRYPKTKYEDTRFDLWFLTTSFLIDALLTAATAFCNNGWQLFLAASILPLASGSAPAAKGAIVSLCKPEDRGDALAGIAMVEMLATVLTMTLFGFIFSALAAVGRSNMVFFINAGLALGAAVVTLAVRIPSESAEVSPEEVNFPQQDE